MEYLESKYKGIERYFVLPTWLVFILLNELRGLDSDLIFEPFKRYTFFLSLVVFSNTFVSILLFNSNTNCALIFTTVRNTIGIIKLLCSVWIMPYHLRIRVLCILKFYKYKIDCINWIVNKYFVIVQMILFNYNYLIIIWAYFGVTISWEKIARHITFICQFLNSLSRQGLMEHAFNPSGTEA